MPGAPQNKVQHSAFSGNFNQYGTAVHLSKQEISITIRDIEMDFVRNF